MKINTIKIKIKSQFGTLRNFAHTAMIPEKDLRHFMTGKMNVAATLAMTTRIEKSMARFKGMKVEPPGMITDQMREVVRRGIRMNYNSLREFIRMNPQYSAAFVSKVINGGNKKDTKRVRDLMASVQKKPKKHFRKSKV